MKTEEVENPLILIVKVSMSEIEDMMVEAVLKHLKTVRYTDRELLNHSAEVDMDGRHIVILSYKDYVKVEVDES